MVRNQVGDIDIVKVNTKHPVVYIIFFSLDILRNFFDKSSIGGFSHIASSHGIAAKVFWVLVVIASWVVAGFAINDAFKFWANNPTATLTETFPISDINFPNIIVCPPKGVLSFNLLDLNHIMSNKLERLEASEYSP